MLCGGASARMGRPKAWLPVGGEAMLRRVVRAVGEAAGPVVVAAAPGQDVPPLPAGTEVVRDEVGGLGPLAGLLAGLDAVAGRADAVYLTGCDAPFLAPAFVRRVVELLAESGASACVPEAGGRLHPLAAAYRADLRGRVRQLVSAGERRMTALLGGVPVRRVGPAELADADPDLRSLTNVNTPTEYAAVLRRRP